MLDHLFGDSLRASRPMPWCSINSLLCPTFLVLPCVGWVLVLVSFGVGRLGLCYWMMLYMRGEELALELEGLVAEVRGGSGGG